MKEINFELKLFCLPIFSFKISTSNKVKINIEEEKYGFPENAEKLVAPEKISTANLNAFSTGSIRPDLKELEKEIFKIEEVPEPIKVKCMSCDGTTYDDDLDFCAKCGKQICSNCGSVDLDREKYCSECWANL